MYVVLYYFYIQSSTFVFSTFVTFYVESNSTLNLSTFYISMFGLSMLCLSTFCLSTVGLSKYGLSTFRHTIITVRYRYFCNYFCNIVRRDDRVAELMANRPVQHSSNGCAGTRFRVISIWGLGPGLVSQVPCLGNAIVMVGIKKTIVKLIAYPF